MDKRYLLTAATAFALGAGTVQLADLDAHASEPQTRPAQGSAVYTVAQASAATGLQMANAACDNIDAQLGLTGVDSCTIADLTSFCLFFNDSENPGMVKLVGNASLAGEWTRAAP